MSKIITTSIRIDDEIWKKTRIKAIEQGITVTEFLNNMLKERI